MPRVVPRFKALFSTGFGYVAFLMAHIYCSVRLLPTNHPYLNSNNIGRFGLRHVVSEASRNIKFTTNNIDQMIIYFAMLAGIFMLAAQLVIMVYAVFIQPAMAFSWFDTADPAQDIAYELLDRVFGVPEVFCSSYTPANCTDFADTMGISGGARLPFHIALHELFRFYSTGLLLIAVLIFLYFVVVIILETAVTGAPFGQRFKNVWVPIRLIVALGLLMPINYGLNSGQFIVLYAAKWGSSFATNGWDGYNDAIRNHSFFTGYTGSSNGVPLGERWTYVAIPEAPDITPLLMSMSLVHACAYAYHRLAGPASGGSAIPNTTSGSGNYYDIDANYTNGATEGSFRVQPYLVKQPIASMTNGAISGSPLIGNRDPYIYLQNTTTADYMAALGFYYGSDIIIRFGERKVSSGDPSYSNELGNVKPLCGDIKIPVLNLLALDTNSGPDAMRKFYYDTVLRLWFNTVQIRQFARHMVVHSINLNEEKRAHFCSSPETYGGSGQLSGQGTAGWGLAPNSTLCEQRPPTQQFRARLASEEDANLRAAISNAWGTYVTTESYSEMNAIVLARGWGGAGIWYNKIAEINSAWMDGVSGIPTMDKFPLIMEQIREWKLQHNENIEGLKAYDPTLQAGSAEESSKQFEVALGSQELVKIGEALADMFAFWTENSEDALNMTRSNFGDVFRSGAQMLLGTTGLLSIRSSNAFLHPLAQLVAVGKGLVNSAVVNMAGATASAFMGGMFEALGKQYSFQKGISDAASSVFFAMAFMGLTAGFVLFYVLPFLPFVYFYFAVGSWLKAIFEAMVGVPLWALAHLRIDGEGLPGDAAQNGYFLILEIFIRPILTVFGLVAAITIFAAQVRILNLIWDLVAANMSGYTPREDILGQNYTADSYFRRDIADEFFFTVIYTIVVYMLALASFKLIDKIPDNILRWAGAGVSSFGDMDNDHADSLSRYAAYGGMTVGNQAASATVDLSRGMGGMAGGEIAKFNQSPP